MAPCPDDHCLAWRFLAFLKPPVTHIFPIDDRDHFGYPVGIVHHVLPNCGAISDKSPRQPIVRPTSHARRVQKTQRLELSINWYPVDVVWKFWKSSRPQLHEPRAKL